MIAQTFFCRELKTTVLCLKDLSLAVTVALRGGMGWDA